MIRTPPLVTVIAACYNHSRFVIETLESVRNQTYPNIQLIITDDFSTDGSVQIIEDWIASCKVKCLFLKNKQNIGICRTINQALCVAEGKYVSMVATDDILLADKVQSQVQLMDASSDDVGVVYSDAWQIDEYSRQSSQSYCEALSGTNQMPQGDILERLLDLNFIPGPTALIRKECFEQVGKYDEKLCYEDWDMWLRIAQHYKFGYCPTPTVKYRVVATSTTRTLLSDSSEVALRSNFRIFAKTLKAHKRHTPGSPNWDDAIAEKVKKQLLLIAESLYHRNASSSSAYLFGAFRHNPNLWTLRLLFYSLLGIPYETSAKLNSRLAHYKRILKGKSL